MKLSRPSSLLRQVRIVGALLSQFLICIVLRDDVWQLVVAVFVNVVVVVIIIVVVIVCTGCVAIFTVLCCGT